MTFRQLTNWVSLNDILLGISPSTTFFNDTEIDVTPERSTMSDSHKKQTYKVLAQIYYELGTKAVDL